MSLSVLLWRSARLLPNIQISNRQFFTNPVLAGRGKTNWKYLSKECEDRTRIILKDRARLESLYTVPEFTQNIRDLFHFFPLSPDKVEGILLDHPEILNCDSSRVIDYIQLLVGRPPLPCPAWHHDNLLLIIVIFKTPGTTISSPRRRPCSAWPGARAY